MVRISQPALSLLAVTAIAVPAASARAAGPPIAYAKEAGAGFDLYLANPNGTGAIKLYSGPSRNSLRVDMNPSTATANELALVESRSTGFKIIRYSDAGVKQPIQVFNDGCWVDSHDYHPTDGSLLIIRRCPNPQLIEIRVWSNGSYGPVIASTDGQLDSYSSARWLGDGSGFLVRYSAVGSGTIIQRRNMANPSAPSTVWSSSSLSGATNIDTARCAGSLESSCMRFLYDDMNGQVHEVRFDDMGTVSDNVVLTGFGGHYSPDNSRIIYRAQVKGGFTLNVTNPAQATAGKSSYSSWDWRP